MSTSSFFACFVILTEENLKIPYGLLPGICEKLKLFTHRPGYKVNCCKDTTCERRWTKPRWLVFADVLACCTIHGRSSVRQGKKNVTYGSWIKNFHHKFERVRIMSMKMGNICTLIPIGWNFPGFRVSPIAWQKQFLIDDWHNPIRSLLVGRFIISVGGCITHIGRFSFTAFCGEDNCCKNGSLSSSLK